MAKYRAKADLYVGGRLIKAGEAFEADGEPGEKWESLDPKTDAKGAEITIPENWRDLQDSQRINLARRLGAPVKGTGTAEADATIEAELAHREAAKAAT
jgi:hypothetical protein